MPDTRIGTICGYSHTACGHDGGQAEYVRVPMADVGPTVIPADLDLDDAVLLTDAYGPTFNAIPIGNAVNKGLMLRMNQTSVKRHLPRLIEHIQAGRIKPSEVITHRMPLEEVADAYHMFSSKLDNCIKTVLVPPGSRVSN